MNAQARAYAVQVDPDGVYARPIDVSELKAGGLEKEGIVLQFDCRNGIEIRPKGSEIQIQHCDDRTIEAVLPENAELRVEVPVDSGGWGLIGEAITAVVYSLRCSDRQLVSA